MLPQCTNNSKYITTLIPVSTDLRDVITAVSCHSWCWQHNSDALGSPHWLNTLVWYRYIQYIDRYIRQIRTTRRLLNQQHCSSLAWNLRGQTFWIDTLISICGTVAFVFYVSTHSTFSFQNVVIVNPKHCLLSIVRY